MGKTLTTKTIFAPVREYNRTISFGVIETGQTIEIPITGKALKPAVELSITTFNFPDTAVGDHSDITFTISNKSEELPIFCNIQKVAHFKSSPLQSKLQPLQSQEVVLSFAPKQVSILALFRLY